MQRNYIFKTKDGLHEVSIRGIAGLKKMEELKQDNPKLAIQAGTFVTTIITDFEDGSTLEKDIKG